MTGTQRVGALHARNAENTLVATSPDRLVKTYRARMTQGIQNAHVVHVVEQFGKTARQVLGDDAVTKLLEW